MTMVVRMMRDLIMMMILILMMMVMMVILMMMVIFMQNSRNRTIVCNVLARWDFASGTGNSTLGTWNSVFFILEADLKVLVLLHLKWGQFLRSYGLQ